MRIRLPHKHGKRWAHVSLKIMCALAILIAIIVTILGLPASIEFPIALITVSVFALYEHHNQKHHKEEK